VDRLELVYSRSAVACMMMMPVMLASLILVAATSAIGFLPGLLVGTLLCAAFLSWRWQAIHRVHATLTRDEVTLVDLIGRRTVIAWEDVAHIQGLRTNAPWLRPPGYGLCLTARTASNPRSGRIIDPSIFATRDTRRALSRCCGKPATRTVSI
jgi:hypothetical protein